MADNKIKYKSGDRIGNSSLYVEATFYGNLKCRCSECQQYSVYKESDVNNNTRCKICAAFESAPRNIKPTNDMVYCKTLEQNSYIGKYRSGSYAISTAKVCRGYKLWDKVGELLIQNFLSMVQGRGAYGVSMKAPEKVVLQCPYCGYYKRVISIDELDNCGDLHCEYCKKVMDTARKEVDELTKSKGNYMKKVAANRDDKKAESTKENGESQLIKRMKSPLDSMKTGSKLDKLVNKVKELNPELKIQDVESVGSSYKILCTCDRCGTEVIIPSTKRNKEMICPGCEKLKTDMNYSGAYNRDYVGTSKNLLELLERTGDACRVKCNSCGREFENIKFYDWYKGRVMCDCEYNTLDGEILCNKCGEYLTIKLKDMLGRENNMDEVVCSKCGKSSGTTYQEIINSFIETPSIAITTSNKLGIAKNKIKTSTERVNDVIVKSKEPLYIGTDGNMYYKCTCLEHNTDMILNDDEITTFNHSQCSDARQHMMNDITKDNIKLS